MSLPLAVEAARAASPPEGLELLAERQAAMDGG
jgi:hypothetical protein